MANNFARLKEEADIGEVIDHLGIPVHRKGSARFILCPLPDHDDQHPTNCYFKPGWNSCYCSVCHKSIQAIDLIMYTTGLDYGHSADELWQLEGCPDWYYDRNYSQEKKRFSITPTEMKLLGIQFHSRVNIPLRATTHKEMLNEALPNSVSYAKGNGSSYLLQKRSASLQWTNFLPEKSMIRLVKKKCSAKLQELDRLEQELSHVLGVKTTIFTEERETIQSILARTGGAHG